MHAHRRPQSPAPASQRIAGAVILLLLFAIAAAIAIKGRYYDPEQEAINPATLAVAESDSHAPVPPVPINSLEKPRPPIPSITRFTTATFSATRPATATLAAALPTTTTLRPAAVPARADSRPATATIVIARPAPNPTLSTGSTSSTASTSSTLSTSPSSDLVFRVPGLVPAGLTEHYPADRLYEKIDGQDASYLSFGVRRLRFITLKLASDPARTIDVYDYEMSTPEGAAGIFARERDPQGAPLPFISTGYRSGPALFFTRGAHYWQLIPLDPDPPLSSLTESLAREILK